MDCNELRDDMLEALYGEADPATERRVNEHQAGCAACREEWKSLQQLRQDLTSWVVPARAESRVVRRPSRLPAWLAAAAGLILALGGALGFSGSEMRFENGRFGFRLGRDSSNFRALLAEQETRHQKEIETLRASLATALSEETLMRRVNDMIRESEARQAVLLNASLSELTDQSEAQRRLDLARMSAGLSYLEGQTGKRLARTNELVGYVLQASQRR